MNNRPTTSDAGHNIVTTPKAQLSIQLLGIGIQRKGLSLTRDEFRSIKNLYGFKSDETLFMQAGSDRNAIRHAETDGLRLLAWIAKFVPPGTDPLKSLIAAAVDSGWDGLCPQSRSCLTSFQSCTKTAKRTLFAVPGSGWLRLLLPMMPGKSKNRWR